MSTPTEFRQFTKNFFEIERLKKNWGWFLLLGLILIGLGTFSIAASTLVTVLSVFVLGSVLLAGGAVQIVYSFWMREWSGFFLSLLAGILYGIVGLMLLVHPAVGAITITLLLAAFYIVGGIFRIVTALTAKFNKWGWALFSGIIKLALGILIWAGWPATGLWVLGLFIGIDLIFFGWFWVVLALSAKKAR